MKELYQKILISGLITLLPKDKIIYKKLMKILLKDINKILLHGLEPSNINKW